MSDISALMALMIQHNAGNPESINRMMKLYSFARAIALEEGVSDSARETIETAAIVGELAAGSADGATYADMLLLNLGCCRELIAKVHKIISKPADTADELAAERQIFAEADFLVTAFEKRFDKESIVEELNQGFKTATGKQFLCNMFSVGNRRRGDNV